MKAHIQTVLNGIQSAYYEDTNSIVLASYGALQAKLVTPMDKEYAKLQSYAGFKHADNSVAVVITDESNESEVLALCQMRRLINHPQKNNLNVSEHFSQFKLPDFDPSITFLEMSPFYFVHEEKTHRLQWLLWQAIEQYCTNESIDYMVGSLTLNSRYPAAFALELSYLHHFYLADPKLRAKAINGVTMDIMPEEAINPIQAFSILPPMFRYCLRLGAKVGEGVFVDQKKNEIHVFFLLPIQAKSVIAPH